MAREGDVIENPVSGARIVFRKTARNTNGELLQFDLFFKRHLIGGARLIHPRQEMRFEVVFGHGALPRRREGAKPQRGPSRGCSPGRSPFFSERRR